jgi:TatD DNase family protein
VAFTDSHAHLDDARFDADRAEVIARARGRGVERILTVALGTTRAEWQRALDLGGQNEAVWAAVGLHPHEARHANEAALAELDALAAHPRVLAWGEIGLDYHYDHSPRETQRQVFREQLRLARTRRLPVVIHCREAWDHCLAILAEAWAPSGLGGVLHCFSGSEAEARRVLDWGILISFAGNVTFPRAEALREVARALPKESLLVETDCPYLAPQSRRGQRNEPAFVTDVAAELARIRGMSSEELGAQTTENFLRLFPRACA